MKLVMVLEKGDTVSDLPVELAAPAVEPILRHLYAASVADKMFAYVRTLELSKALVYVDTILEGYFNTPDVGSISVELPLEDDTEENTTTVQVPSSTRRGMYHTVTLDADNKAIHCTCEGFTFSNTCKHVKSNYMEAR